MSDAQFTALVADSAAPFEDTGAGTGAGTDEPELHLSLDVARDLEEVKTAPPPSGPPQPEVAAARKPAAPSPTPAPTPKKAKQQQHKRDASAFASTATRAKPGDDAASRKFDRKINAALAAWFTTASLVCWIIVSGGNLKIRLRRILPLVEDSMQEDGYILPNSVVARGGLDVVVGYTALTMLVTCAVYFITCILPPCGPRYLPWNWHNEDVYWRNRKMSCNPTYWIALGWTNSMGTLLVLLLVCEKDLEKLILYAFVAAPQCWLMSFTEEENENSPHRSKAARPFFFAFFLFVVRWALMWNQYSKLSEAETPSGSHATLEVSGWIYFAVPVYLLGDLLSVAIAAGRNTGFCCCRGFYEHYKNYHNWNRGILAVQVTLLSLITVNGLRAMA
jgi:hypothetical protein